MSQLYMQHKDCIYDEGGKMHCQILMQLMRHPLLLYQTLPEPGAIQLSNPKHPRDTL